MKIKISILGSTGSIGDSTLKIIDQKRSLFNINTLYANKNYMKICNQIKKYNPKSFVVNNTNIFTVCLENVFRLSSYGIRIHGNLISYGTHL